MVKLTKNVILEIEGHDELLAEKYLSKGSLDYRMPYFNILNYIQLELIKASTQWSAHATVKKMIHTINGNATGLRNSGS